MFGRRILLISGVAIALLLTGCNTPVAVYKPAPHRHYTPTTVKEVIIYRYNLNFTHPGPKKHKRRGHSHNTSDHFRRHKKDERNYRY